MAAGGYVYEKETATYDSSVFNTKLDWALHVFRKQIYAFLAASTRSATVNGDAHQYWDLDTTRWEYSSDKKELDDSSDGVHTPEEWEAVSEAFLNQNTDPDAVYPIFSYTSDTAYPALGCFFVGRGGEHLFFCNSTKVDSGTHTDNAHMHWYSSSDYNSTLEIDEANSSYDLFNNCTMSIYAGFNVMFSPNSNFVGNTPSVAGFRPRSCLPPMGIVKGKTTSNGSTYSVNGYFNGETKTVIGSTSTQEHTFGFCVKRDQVIYLYRRADWGSGVYCLLIFGNILNNLSNEGDTNAQAALSISTSLSETSISTLDSSLSAYFNARYESAFGRYPICFADANGDGVFNFNGYIRSQGTSKTMQPSIVPSASSQASKVPYSAFCVACLQNRSTNGYSVPLVKNGIGTKGFVNTDILRAVPMEKCVGGATFENGKFMSPTPYTPYSGGVVELQQSISFIIGWDPSNEL